MNDLPASPSDGGTHGFLFADLRGYTHLVDTRGAVEASHLLGRYRAIVREVLTHHGGAEIKTEGDSFYVVLPSASAALRCGLDILRACREPSDGGQPIELGIGIHAGESVAHQGGFVGSAVNIAARICALAAAGELLVSGTIRELSRSIVAAEFVPVGRRALKGLDQPVEVFRVVAEGASPSVQGRSREAASGGLRFWWLAVAAVVIAGAGAGAVVSGLLGKGNLAGPTASSGPSGSQLAASPSLLIGKLPEQGRVSPGTYAPNHNRAVASVTVSGSDWTLQADVEDILFFYKPSPPGAAGVGIAQITVVYTGGCPGDSTRIIGSRPQDLIDWVQSAPQLDASEPRTVNNLGRSGIAIEATVLAPPSGCGGTPVRPGTRAEVSLLGIGDGSSWSPFAGTRIVFEALDDGSRTLTAIFSATTAAELAAEAAVSQELLAGFVLRE